MPPELERLLSAAPPDRDDAWSEFLRAFSPTLLRVARSLGRDHDAVMDRYAYVLDQLRADECRRLRAYDRPGAGDFLLWLVVVARRLCLDHHRARYGRVRHGKEADRESGEARRTRRRLVDLVGDQVDLGTISGRSDDAPDEAAVRAERDGKIEAALAALDPRDRLLVRLRFSEEMSAREIGELMRFPTVFHVYRRLEIVLRILRGHLTRAGLDRAAP
jgi:RNA polymerase sigma factor (sigma-70 family)